MELAKKVKVNALFCTQLASWLVFE